MASSGTGTMASSRDTVDLVNEAQRSKRELRRLAVDRRRSRSALPDDARRLTRAALALPPLATARTLAVFEPLPDEPDVNLLVKALTGRGVTILLPVYARGEPDLVGWREPGVATEDAGPPSALRDADAVLVPAFAVDESGTRLGRGGGWYDRALAWTRPGALLLAVLHPWEVCGPGERLPREEHDVRMNGWLTAAGARLIV